MRSLQNSFLTLKGVRCEFSDQKAAMALDIKAAAVLVMERLTEPPRKLTDDIITLISFP